MSHLVLDSSLVTIFKALLRYLFLKGSRKSATAFLLKCIKILLTWKYLTPKVYAENISLQKLKNAVTKVKIRFNKLQIRFYVQKLVYALEKSAIPKIYAS